MAIIENKVNIDKTTITAVLQLAWKFLSAQPKWLKVLVCAVLIGSGIYYAYRYYNDVNSINTLTTQVETIENKVDNQLDINTYRENEIYVISEIKLIQQMEEQMYNDQTLELELMSQFIERHHPGDPIIHDLQAMKMRLDNSHEVYKQHYSYFLQRLTTLTSDTVKIVY